MAELLSVTAILPEYCVTASETCAAIRTALPQNMAGRFVRMVQMSQNETRYSVLPFEEVRAIKTLDRRNIQYSEHAVRLATIAAREALRMADVGPKEINAVIGVSSTGHLMPTLETHVIDRLHLPSSSRRVPLTQLGCAGGVASVGLARMLTEAEWNANILIVSVELPSLSFPVVEPSPTDIVASSQFGDGAAAAVVSRRSGGRGPVVIDSASALFPGTVDDDGVRSTEVGLRLCRPRRLADTLRRELGAVVDEFLARKGLRRADVSFWAIHPRSPELLAAAAASLGLAESALAASRAVWRRAGNLVSAAVFHVLQEFGDASPRKSGELGMAIAYGAGFGCEMVLLEASGWLCGRPARVTTSAEVVADAPRA